MTRWQLVAAIVLSCATTSGCKFHHLTNANQDLERENFQLEQRLDELTWQLEDARSALHAQQCATPSGKTPAAGTGIPRLRRSEPAEPTYQAPAVEGEPDIGAPPHVELPDEELDKPSARRKRVAVPRFTGPPVISPPDPDLPDGELPEPIATPNSGARNGAHRGPANAEPASEAVPAGVARRAGPKSDLVSQEISEAPAFEPPPTEAEPLAEPGAESTGQSVATLAINEQATQWRRTDGHDEGLRVVVEPCDREGRLVGADGKIAIVVLDPSQNGKAARLARWDFTAEQTAEHSRGTRPGGGFHFDLQWPNAAPTATDLLLFVRLTTTAGEQLVAEFALQPTSANQPASWTEATNETAKSDLKSRQRGASDGWQRATAPLPKPVQQRAAQVESAAERADESASVVAPDAGTQEDVEPAAREPDGPQWAPYR